MSLLSALFTIKRMSQDNLNGKVAVITGASKGLGKAMAVALGAAGASIALVSRGSEELNGVKHTVEKMGGKAQVFPTDVSEEDQIRKLEHDVIGAFNRVDILIISKISLGRWGRVEEVGQLAVYLCSENAGFITGTDILIDGGWTAQ